MARIPTNLVTGFLGSGKTTTILNLLKRKPTSEKWAVLVNEFGEVGIDGAMLQGQGAVVREVPGGCMCCVAGVPMQIGLNMLIARAKPDRLLIEPTGLGHPSQILAVLTNDQYRELLDLKATLCLIDPRKLADSRYTENVNFKDQARLADMLVGNKADTASAEDRQRFQDWVASFDPPKSAAGLFSYGNVPLDWLDQPFNPLRSAEQPKAHANVPVSPGFLQLPVFPALTDREPAWRRIESRGQGHQSCGWIFRTDQRFSFDRLFAWCSGLAVTRLKAVMNTDRGWFFFNALDAVLTVTEGAEAVDSRIELIHSSPKDWPAIEQQLLACRLPDEGASA